MRMMQNLRDNTHIILWSILILFILSMTIGGLVGGANIMDILSGKNKLQGAAGKVNSTKLDGAQYARMVQSEIARLQEQGQEINDQLTERVSDQVWNQFINETLIGQEIDRLGLQATDKEIYTQLVENPPAFLQQNEAFLTDGNFDYQKYLDILNNPQGNEWVGIEQYLRASIPFGKIQSLVQSLVTLSGAEVHDRYVTENVKFDLETVKLPFTIVARDTFPIKDNEIGAYYAKNKKDYFREEQRSLEYVLFEMKPSPADTFSIVQLLTDLKSRIERGESFEPIANDYTQDPSGKESGGDLGWFGRGQMVPEFEQAAFAARKGELVGPVLTQFGYHLIKIEDKRRQNGEDQVKARHILMKLTPGPETIDAIRTEANHFVFDATEYGFEASADSHKVQVQKSIPFRQEDKFVTGIGYFPQGTKFAFSDIAVGTVSDLMNSDDKYVIVKLAEIKEASYSPQSEVAEQIKSKIQDQKRLDKLSVIADELYAKIQATGDMRSALEIQPAVEYKKHDQATLNRNLEGISRSSALTGAILSLAPDQIARPIEIANNRVIVKLLQRAEIDENHYKVEKEVMRSQMLNQKKNTFYSNWVMSLRDEAKIIDNRANMY